jgi:hypothetical protein
MAKADDDTTPSDNSPDNSSTSNSPGPARRHELLKEIEKDFDDQIEAAEDQAIRRQISPIKNAVFYNTGYNPYRAPLPQSDRQDAPSSPAAVQAVAQQLPNNKQPPPSIDPTGAGVWLKAEFERMRDAGEIPKDVRRQIDLAKLLEKQMGKAADANGFVDISSTGKSVHKVELRHIKNNLRKWGIWPL